jgi:hypothetical protein
LPRPLPILRELLAPVITAPAVPGRRELLAPVISRVLRVGVTLLEGALQGGVPLGSTGPFPQRVQVNKVRFLHPPLRLVPDGTPVIKGERGLGILAPGGLLPRGI